MVNFVLPLSFIIFAIPSKIPCTRCKKHKSKLYVFGFAELLLRSLEIKVNFYSLAYTNFGSFVCIFEDNLEDILHSL